MANYKVIQKFRDIKTNKIYEENQEIEMTVKRGDEAIKNLKKYNGEFLERIDNKEPDEDEEVEEPEENEEG